MAGINMKRAGMFMITLTIMMLVILSSIIGIIVGKYVRISGKHKIGEDQLRLFSLYHKGEDALVYVDISAKYSMWKSAFKLADNGGYYDVSPCGRYIGLNSWGYDYGCFPNTHPDSLKEQFWNFFKPSLDAYLDKYSTATGLTIPRDYSRYKLTGDSERTSLAAFATSPIIIKTANADYRVKPSFNVKIEHDMPETFDYLKDNIDSVLNKLKTESPHLDTDTGMTWYLGSCPDTPPEYEAFYKFVDEFVTCQQAEQLGDHCTCGGIDVGTIPEYYAFGIEQSGDYTRLTLRKKDLITGAYNEVAGLWSKGPNKFNLAYRYSCQDGNADCGNTGECVPDQLKEDEDNCGECGTSVEHSCVEGRQYCVNGMHGASCTSEVPNDCTYGCRVTDCDVCGEKCTVEEECSETLECPVGNPGCLPEEMICPGDMVCPVPEVCSTCLTDCYGTNYCGVDDCRLLACPSVDDTPSPRTSYPTYSYDHAAGKNEIVIERASCPGSEFCQGSVVQFVKFDNNVGVLRKLTEDIHSKSADGRLSPWKACGPKKTYRFCVQTEEKFHVYDDLSGSWQQKPLRYKFAVQVVE